MDQMKKKKRWSHRDSNGAVNIGSKGEKWERTSLCKKIKKINLKNEDGTGLEELLHLSLKCSTQKRVWRKPPEWKKSRTSHKDTKAQPGERKGYPLQYFGPENSMEDMDAFCFSVLMAKTRKYVVKARHARLLQSRFFQMGSLKTWGENSLRHIIKSSSKRNTNGWATWKTFSVTGYKYFKI